jgi:hypothetical protein
MAIATIKKSGKQNTIAVMETMRSRARLTALSTEVIANLGAGRKNAFVGIPIITFIRNVYLVMYNF